MLSSLDCSLPTSVICETGPSLKFLYPTRGTSAQVISMLDIPNSMVVYTGVHKNLLKIKLKMSRWITVSILFMIWVTFGLIFPSAKRIWLHLVSYCNFINFVTLLVEQKLFIIKSFYLFLHKKFWKCSSFLLVCFSVKVIFETKTTHIHGLSKTDWQNWLTA